MAKLLSLDIFLHIVLVTTSDMILRAVYRVTGEQSYKRMTKLTWVNKNTPCNYHQRLV